MAVDKLVEVAGPMASTEILFALAFPAEPSINTRNINPESAATARLDFNIFVAPSKLN
jgi:hypothetical protein